MKSRNIILGVIIFCGFSCKTTVNNREISVNSNDSIKASVQLVEQIKNPSIINSLYIDILRKFYDGDDYYINLYSIGEFSEAANKEIIENNTGVVYQGIEEVRKKLDKVTVSKYFAVENIETLLVFNDYQEVEDTITLQYFEYYDVMIESSFIASYKGTQGLSNKIVISKSGFDNATKRKSPVFISDSAYQRLIILRNSFIPDLIYGSGYTTYKGDTIAFLSFSDYSKGKDCLYLLKNGIPTDSVINDYVIKKMIPVPIANKNEIFYISEVGIPETDNSWTILTGIELKSTRFLFYSRNRFEY